MYFLGSNFIFLSMRIPLSFFLVSVLPDICRFSSLLFLSASSSSLILNGNLMIETGSWYCTVNEEPSGLTNFTGYIRAYTGRVILPKQARKQLVLTAVCSQAATFRKAKRFRSISVLCSD